MESVAYQNGYSARIRLHLAVGGQRLKLSHIGPEYIMVDAPIHLAPCDAEIVMQVDEAGGRCPFRTASRRPRTLCP